MSSFHFKSLSHDLEGYSLDAGYSIQRIKDNVCLSSHWSLIQEKGQEYL